MAAWSRNALRWCLQHLQGSMAGCGRRGHGACLPTPGTSGRASDMALCFSVIASLVHPTQEKKCTPKKRKKKKQRKHPEEDIWWRPSACHSTRSVRQQPMGSLTHPARPQGAVTTPRAKRCPRANHPGMASCSWMCAESDGDSPLAAGGSPSAAISSVSTANGTAGPSLAAISCEASSGTGGMRCASNRRDFVIGAHLAIYICTYIFFFLSKKTSSCTE